jgi:hypothetical protein
LTNSLTRIRIELGKRAKATDGGPDWGELQAEADRIVAIRARAGL